MDVANIFYHGICEQVRRVLNILGEERTDMGLTAFEDGASNWSHCFFARALAPQRLGGEYDVAKALDLWNGDKTRLNVVPVRIVYRTFDGASSMMTKEQLKALIVQIRDESREPGLMEFLRTIDYTDVETKPAVIGPVCETDDNKWGSKFDVNP